MTRSQVQPIPSRSAAPPDSATLEGSYSGVVSSTVKYLLRTEVHTFAFSVAANALLSFFPFVLLLMTLIRRVFHSPVMYDVVVQLLRDFLPAGQDFVIRNLNALVDARHRAQIASLIILLVTSTGIFMPLEVALESHLAISQQPLLFWKPIDRSGPGIQLRRACLALDCSDRGKYRLPGSFAARPRTVCGPAGRISDDEDVRHLRQHRHFLSHLLAAAQRQSACPGGASRRP